MLTAALLGESTSETKLPLTESKASERGQQARWLKDLMQQFLKVCVTGYY